MLSLLSGESGGSDQEQAPPLKVPPPVVEAPSASSLSWESAVLISADDLRVPCAGLGVNGADGASGAASPNDGAGEESAACVEHYCETYGISREVLWELERRGELRHIPVVEGVVSSVGSIKHADGECHP